MQCELLTDISKKDQLLEDTTATLVLAEEQRNKALEEIVQTTEQLKDYISKLLQLEQDKEQLTTQLRETQDGHKKLKRILGKQTHAVDILSRETASLQYQLRRKHKEIAMKTAEADNLKARLQETTEKFETASIELNKLKAEQESLKSDLETKRQALERQQYRSELKDERIQELKVYVYITPFMKYGNRSFIKFCCRENLLQ